MDFFLFLKHNKNWAVWNMHYIIYSSERELFRLMILGMNGVSVRALKSNISVARTA